MTDPVCPTCGRCHLGESSRAEEVECAHMYLDDLGVPREEESKTLSLVGRIQASQARSTIRSQVEAFCVAAGHPVRKNPQTPPEDEVKLRTGLVVEEFFEFLQALYPQLKNVNEGSALYRLREVLRFLRPEPDLVALADAMADLDYVVEGTRLAFGINGAPIAEEVQRTNMAKFGPGSWKREDGKQMKPPDWEPPDIEGELRKQMKPEPLPVRYPDIVCQYCGERNCTKALLNKPL